VGSSSALPDQIVDLLVVGCGAGGLAAALSRLEASPGANVVVLERSSRENRGGNTSWTGSFFRLLPDGSPADDFVARMHQLGRGKSNPDVIATLADQAKPTIDWLRSHGLSFESRPTYFGTAQGPRLMPVGGGAALVNTLARRVEQLGGVIRYDTAACGLTRRPEGHFEIKVSGPGTGDEIRAVAVILACGGFEGNTEMLVKHLGSFAEWLPPITQGGRSNQGEGIDMALSMGADTAGQFDRFHGEPVDPRSRVGEALVMAYPYGILINSDGQRFVDEGSDTPDNTFEEVAYLIWAQQQQTAHLIGDNKLATMPNLSRMILTDKRPITAGSLPELAKLMDVDPESLEATVADYNTAVPPGPIDPDRLDGMATVGLDPPKSNWAQPIDTPPFVAWPVICAITFTYGGLRTDTLGRVQTAANEPIPNLYAVGEVAGLYYHSYPGATSVLRALAFGRIAGRDSASPRETLT
jgi:tricarballylate dehydrogenase